MGTGILTLSAELAKISLNLSRFLDLAATFSLDIEPQYKLDETDVLLFIYDVMLLCCSVLFCSDEDDEVDLISLISLIRILAYAW